MLSPTGVGKMANVPLTPTSSTGPICRICHEGDVKEDLTAPCKCAGSMQLVHRTCLEKWLSSSNSNACEICKFKFIIYRQPRPFSEWVRMRTNPEEWRNIIGDVLCFLLLTPLAGVSSYLCFTGAKHYTGWNTKWEASGLICLSIMLISIYITWVFVTVRYHHRSWKDWREVNQDVFLIQMRQLSSSAPSLSHSPTSVFSFSGTDVNATLSSPNSAAISMQVSLEAVDAGRGGAALHHRGMSTATSPSSNSSRTSGQHRHCRQPLLVEDETRINNQETEM